MTLHAAKKDGKYTVKELLVEPIAARRLQALGLNEGTQLTVLNRKRKGALIIRVRGTRLALGRHLSANISIEEADENA